ncbi:MAG TPA: hypothetical protein V6D28_25410 [Leptolyngbyaceae cyanobacterium]
MGDCTGLAKVIIPREIGDCTRSLMVMAVTPYYMDRQIKNALA